jgi:hypothetical protein
MSHTTNATAIVAAIFSARKAKMDGGGVFTVKQAEAVVAEQLAALYPAKAKRTGPKMVGAASDEEFLVWLEANPAYAGIDVRRELGKAQAWAGVKGKAVSRSRFVNWLNKAERTVGVDGRMASSLAKKPIATEPWHAELPGWKELMTGFPMRNINSALYRDNWRELDDQQKKWVWDKAKREGKAP